MPWARLCPGHPRAAAALSRSPPAPPVSVLYLDPYFLGDPLFMAGFARDLAARPSGLVVVHGSGERGERALEALGRFPRRAGGVWEAEDAEGRAAVERAARELNREIAHELNEAGVPSVRALGADRGLLKESEGLGVGRAEWLGDLVGQGVTAVVASLVDGPDGLAEADPARAAAALALGLGLPLVALTTRSLADGEPDPLGAVPDADAVRRAAETGAAVGLTPRGGLRSPETPTVTYTGR